MRFAVNDLVRLHSVSGLGGRTIRKILEWAAADLNNNLADVFGFDSVILSRLFGLKSAVIDGLHASSAEQAASVYETLDNATVQLITTFDESYPAPLKMRLGDNAPPLLYIIGNAALLSQPGIAFSGSRHTSEAGLHYTAVLAADAVRTQFSVISGHAPGTDTAAHQTALALGGLTTLIVPEGLLKFRLRPELRAAYDQHTAHAVIVSEFPPHMPWSAQNAMIRNLTILGLSQALCVIEAGDSGGTLDAGQRALKLGLPVFALAYADPPTSAPGNRLLIEQGAQPISVTSEPKLPPIRSNPPPSHPTQPKLF